ncbi:MAG: OadG family protein [Burkholderiaceae bacterium]|nr:OadG family protein [Burkholderiaceae bacterium]
MDNLSWGLQITALGMGLVFGLLALLWGLLTLVQRFEPAPADRSGAPAAPVADDPAAAPADTVPAPATVQGIDAELLAAIVTATLVHRALRRREAAPVMRSYLPGSQLHTSRWVGAGRTRQNQSWQRQGQGQGQGRGRS